MCYKVSLSRILSAVLVAPMVFSFFQEAAAGKENGGAASGRTSRARGDGAFRRRAEPPDDKLKPSATRQPVGLPRADIPFASPVSTADAAPLDLSEFMFSETAPEFQIEVEVDPVDAEAEEAAMLFANGQDAAARSLLENATRCYCSGPGERLWLMLFDLLRLTGQKAAFEALGIEYAQSFEKSPPGWHETDIAAPVAAKVIGTVPFRGELTGDNDAGFAAVRQALRQASASSSRSCQGAPTGCCWLRSAPGVAAAGAQEPR
jgi:hypothetical protein